MVSCTFSSKRSEIRTAAARFEIEKYFFRTTEELLESDLLAGLRNEVILEQVIPAFLRS